MRHGDGSLGEVLDFVGQRQRGSPLPVADLAQIGLRDAEFRREPGQRAALIFEMLMEACHAADYYE